MENPSMPSFNPIHVHTATAAKALVKMTGHTAQAAQDQLLALPSHQGSTASHITSNIARSTLSRRINTKASQPDSENNHSPASDLPAINNVHIVAQAPTTASEHTESSTAHTGDQSGIPATSGALVQVKGIGIPRDRQCSRPQVSDVSRPAEQTNL